MFSTEPIIGLSDSLILVKHYLDSIAPILVYQNAPN